MAVRKKTTQFEKSLSALEKLVNELETGELPLDQALQSFEQGIKLTRECQQALAEAEQKVALLTANAQGVSETPFDEEADQ